MINTSPPPAPLESIIWMPPRPADAHPTPLAPTGKRGHPCTDNAELAEARCYFPTIIDTHLATSAKTAHIEIAREMRRRFTAHHSTRLGITEDRLAISNTSDPNPPTYYINRGRPDLLLNYLDGAHVAIHAAARLDTTKCACGAPLHRSSRNYCKTCKAARNRTNAQKRQASPGAARTSATNAEPGTPNRQHAQQLVDSLHTGPARPLIFPAFNLLADIGDAEGRQLLIIDDRHEARNQRRLTDIDLIELARQATDIQFAAGTAGTRHQPAGLTTDVALAVDTLSGVVVWVGEADATNPLMNPATHRLARLGIDICKLLDPTTKARVVAQVKADLVRAAGQLRTHDTTTIADAYELYERARQQPPFNFTSVLELTGIHVPRTIEDWTFIHKFHASAPELGQVRAIDAAMLIASGAQRTDRTLDGAPPRSM